MYWTHSPSPSPSPRQWERCKGVQRKGGGGGGGGRSVPAESGIATPEYMGLLLRSELFKIMVKIMVNIKLLVKACLWAALGAPHHR